MRLVSRTYATGQMSDGSDRQEVTRYWWVEDFPGLSLRVSDEFTTPPPQPTAAEARAYAEARYPEVIERIRLARVAGPTTANLDDEIDTLQAFLAASAPTNAQAVAAMKALIRVVAAIVRVIRTEGR